MSNEELVSPETIKEELAELVLNVGERTKDLNYKLQGRPRLLEVLRGSLIDSHDTISDGNPAHFRITGKSLLAIETLYIARTHSGKETQRDKIDDLLGRPYIHGEEITDTHREDAIEHIKNFAELLDELGL